MNHEMIMKTLTSVLTCATVLLPLLTACSTDVASVAPVQAISVCLQPVGEDPETAEMSRRIAAFSHEERMTLARALIETHDWGTWGQHAKLRATFGDEELGNPLVNENIVKKLRLPADASPALREVVQVQLKEQENNWLTFLPFLDLVTDDYLPEHPQDARAWQFLSFMLYISDGEVNYASCICEHIRDKGLNQYIEGQRLLLRDEHWHGCRVQNCPLCNE